MRVSYRGSPLGRRASHTDGLLEWDVRLQICWGADRLDLGKVGILPRMEKLRIRAVKRGETPLVPTLVSSE
jgi:hypothetical protein